MLPGAQAVPLRVVLCSAGGGEDRTRRVLRLVCAARSLRAHLGSRGDCACCAGVPVRGSRGWAGLPSVAFGELPGRRPSVSGESLEAPGVCFMSVGKLCGSLCSGARGSEVGGEQCKQSTCLSPRSLSTPGSLLCRPCQCYCRGSTFYQLLLESVCCTPAFSDARARPVVGASFLEVWVGVWPTRGAPIIRAFARLTWIYTYRT